MNILILVNVILNEIERNLNQFCYCYQMDDNWHIWRGVVSRCNGYRYVQFMVFVFLLREAAKNRYFFNGPATKRGGGGGLGH